MVGESDGVVNFKDMSLQFRALLIRLYRVRFANYPNTRIAEILRMNVTTLHYHELMLRKSGKRSIPFPGEREEDILSEIEELCCTFVPPQG